MKKRNLLPLLITISVFPVFAQGAVAGKTNFTQATISEVVNDVRIVDARSLSARPAKKNTEFFAPDMLRTGRRSRAQLLMRDGTVVRVGSNAVFSFDAEARTIRLQNGTVIFHSPTGKGGGNIVTNSATASVIGTTIMVTATSNGGFKFSVLEGEGKVLYQDGKESRVKAGQMMFVLPKNDGKKRGDGKGAKPGMILNFDLAAMVRESGLLNGFSSTIASSEKIASAIETQGEKIAGGDLQQTGMAILNAAGDRDFYCADIASVRQQSMAADYNFALAQDDSLRVAANLNTDLQLDAANPITDRFVFLNPVEVEGDGWAFSNFTGVLAEQVTFGNGTVDLSRVDGVEQVGIGGAKIVFDGDTTLSGLAKTTALTIGGGEIVTTGDSHLEVIFGGDGGVLNLLAEATSALEGVTISNNTGGILTQVNSGDLRITDSVLNSQNTLARLGESHVAGDMTLVSGSGVVEINASSITATEATLTITGATQVTVDNGALAGDAVRIDGAVVSLRDSVLTAGNDFSAQAADTISLQGTTVTAGDVSLGGKIITVAESEIVATNGVSLIATSDVTATDATLSGDAILLNAGDGRGTLTLSQVRLNAASQVMTGIADTMVFSEVAFSDGALATLYSGTGDFNSGDGVVTGAVNFLGWVTYAGDDAQDFIYVPNLNIGDVESPIHILPVGAEDYRGGKVAYSLSRALEFVTVGDETQLSNNFVYRNTVTLSPEQLGVFVPQVVTAVDPDFLKFCGVLAQSMTVDSALMKSLSDIFQNSDFSEFTMPTVKFYAEKVTLDSSVSMTVPTAITRVEIAGGTLSLPSDFSLSAAFSNSANADNIVSLRTLGALSLNNATVTATHGSLEMQSGASLVMSGGTLTAGCADVSHPNGHVSLFGLSAVVLKNATVTGKQNASRIAVMGATVQLVDSTLQTPVSGAGYIAIQGAKSISLQGGKLIAKDIAIGGVTLDGVTSTPDMLNVNGVQFAVTSDNATVAMAAKTIVVRNVNFSGGSQVTLSSGDGALNVMSSGAAMTGAVNFGSGTVKYADNDITSATGIAQYVNVQGHGATNAKIFFDKVAQPNVGVGGANAPVQIKTLP